MDFAYSPRADALRAQLRQFLDERILPLNPRWHREVEGQGLYPPTFLDEIKDAAKAEGLWNLFLPDLPRDMPGQGLSNLDYAPLAEIMGRVFWASEVFNCNAPDTGNMELLNLFATDEQRQRWLDPLFRGEIRSCFAMTEPGVASSDATNIQTTITDDGDAWIVDGRKWFITGAADPRCALAIVLGVSDTRPDADPHRRHSTVIVPMDAPGLTVLRNIPVMQHLAPEGHCELVFDRVRVPKANLLGEVGHGFANAQARLGPGRIHHCMRTIGQCEVALELMADRALTRRAFGKALAEHSQIGEWIALSRMEIDQARLFVLRAAWKIDREGKRAARVDVSAIKVVAARLQTTVLDRAIQVFGAAGLTPDTPLAFLWTWGRALRFIDGPDEVHIRGVARQELKEAAGRSDRARAYLTPFEGVEERP